MSMNKETNNFSNKLKHAISEGDLVAVRRLVKGGIDVNDKSLSWYGTTVLHLAISKDHLPIVKLLLQAKANVNSPNQDGRTPLHFAARSGNEEIVHELILAKASVNIKTNDGRTALHVATWRGNTEVVRYLVDAGADVNLEDEDKWTPLYWAARSNYRGIAEILISHGADVNHQILHKGFTPLHEALIHGHVGLAKFFIHEGADVNKKGKGQGLSLILLQKNKHIDLVALKDFLEFCVSHGYQLSKDELTTSSKLPLLEKFTKIPEFSDWLNEQSHSVPTLSCLCRNFIREKLVLYSRKKRLSVCIQELPLPKILNSFLEFEGEKCETLLRF